MLNRKARWKFKWMISGVLLIGLAILIWITSSSSHPTAGGTLEFFTVDDGVTWFPDDSTKLAPFDHDGKKAVLARVYQCADGTQFVGYLEKFSDNGKTKIESVRWKPHGGLAVATTASLSGSNILIKKPGSSQWISVTDPAAKAVKSFSCPDGGKDYVQVLP